MAEIRLNKLLKQFNVGISDLVGFLRAQGAELDENPNAKVSDEFLPALEKQFGKDMEALKQSQKVDIHLTDIIDKTNKKQGIEDDNDDDEPVRETIIKSNTFINSKKEEIKPKSEPKPEIKPEIKLEPKPEIKLEPKPEVEPEPKPEIKPEQLFAKDSVPEASEKSSVSGTASSSVETVAPAEVVASDKSDSATSETVSTSVSAEAAAVSANLPETNTIESSSEMTSPESEPVSEPVQSAAPEQESVPAANSVSESSSATAPKPEPSVNAEAAPATPASDVASTSAQPALKVVGKIDLSQFDRKPKKRERIAKGSQKVDVAKAGESISGSASKGGRNQKNQKNQQNQQGQQGQQGQGKRKRDRDRDRFKPAMTEAEQAQMQEEIQKKVKETYARMNEGKKNNFGAKYRKEKREAAAQKSQEEMEQLAADNKVLKVTEFVTVNDLATLMNNTPVVKVIGACMSLGLMVSINQRLDAETLVLVAEEFGYKVEFVTADISEEINSNEKPDAPEDLLPRPPIITVMGHVDHGKTSLLDNIRKTNVIAGEAGGITQHIGAYSVTLGDGRRITFLDTPGHEAFTAMRARGAQLTDIAIIIIAADDAVMPQTIEAINHAQAAGVPMVFAINKVDKPGANPETIRRQLSEMNILVEDWGGKYQCQEISAKKGIGVSELLEKVLLETDLLELKANPNKLAAGAVIESSLDKGRGYLATVLVQEGTLHVGDVMLCGSYYGRVKSMFNERGQKISEAGPASPVSVLGLNGAPAAGEKFNVLADEREAKSIAGKREQLLRIQGIKTQKHMTLEEIGRRIAIGNFKELNIIVKGDVDGSVEALSDSLIKLSTDEVKVNVIHKAVGGISESDVLLAEASDAVIVGFQVRPSVDARKAAERDGIEIRLYSVIYDCINEVKDGIEGMLEPEKKEEIVGTAEVKQTFRISKVGTIAGCLVRDGKMVQKAKVRLIRDGIVIYTGELSSLQIVKDAAKEVTAGKECGMGIAGYNDIKEGDIIESFQIVEIKRTL